MSPKARNSPTAEELLRQVAAQATGRLAVDTLAGTLEAYLMNGELVGAVHPDDDRLLLRRVRMSDGLPDERLRQLEKVSAGGQSIFGQLLDEVEGPVVERLLLDRFRDNLVGLLASADAPEFHAMASVFIDNMQMGLDTDGLISKAREDADLALQVALDTPIVLGTAEGTEPEDEILLDAVTDEPILVHTLLDKSPIETWIGRARIGALVTTGALLDNSVELHELGTDEIEMLRDDELEPLPEEEETVQLRPSVPDAEAEDEDEDIEDFDTTLAQNVLAEAEASDAPDEQPTAPAEEVSDISPEELAKWLDTGDGLSDEDLAFFQDHEDDRGAGQGGFSTESHNLDKVEVEHGSEEVLEADEAPAAKFSAPVLSEHDANEKIEVCNDVLRRVSAAFDAVEGAGRGRAAIQLLVDGAPSKFTTLLHDITVAGDGQLPADDLLDNLASRPISEHRQLINSALKNVIERALSSAADELPEDSFDDVYESVAGYNQRLGL